MSILTRKTLIYGEIEAVYGVAQAMSDSTSAMLVEAADYSLDVQKIARPVYRPTLSSVPDIIGRKMGKIKFTHEVRGNGVVGSESRFGRLLRACSMVATVEATPWWGSFLKSGLVAAVPAVAWVGGGTITGVVEPKTVMFVVTTPGASGTAAVSVTYDDGSTQETGVVLTSGSAHTLTNADATLSAATVTPTWTGSLIAGQTWVATVYPAGIMYKPTSVAASMQSITLNMYKDGILHVLTGALGTYKVSAKAGERATGEFEFTGFYNAPSDTSFPAAPVFETTLPQQVELGRLHIDGFGLAGPQGNPCVVETFSFNIDNKISPRMSINAANGWTGVNITDRKPTGGIDPEATLVGTQDFWTRLSIATQMPFGMRVGTTAGNGWDLSAPSVQYSGLTYKDRQGTQALDAALNFNGIVGDDEIQFYAY